jgi:hypothetical protein
MAFCPNCKKEMGAREIVCPHCGYDFPDPPRMEQRNRGFEYSVLADIALGVGALVAMIVCVGSVLGSIAALFQGELVHALLTGPISFFLSLAMVVVFLRTLRKE